MSLPVISLNRINLHIALYNVIGSIALQESAIAEMMDLNGKMLQRVVEQTDPDSALFDDRYPSGAPEALQDMLDINDTVNLMMGLMQSMEGVLRGKLCCVLQYLNPSISAEDAT